MKLEILIEDGKPLLVLSDQINRNKMIDVYCSEYGHSTAQHSTARLFARLA